MVHRFQAKWRRGEPSMPGSVPLIRNVPLLGRRPIQDALEGLAYINDRQGNDLWVERLDIDSSLRVRYKQQSVAMAFSDGREFAHIKVWALTGAEEAT